MHSLGTEIYKGYLGLKKIKENLHNSAAHQISQLIK